MKKRLISILLSLSMVLTLLPETVLSAGVGTSKAGDATFTLSASSASCADGHTGELGSIQVTGVDISKRIMRIPSRSIRPAQWKSRRA